MYRTTLRHFCPKHLLQENDIQLENQDSNPHYMHMNILLKLVSKYRLPVFLNFINNNSENSDILRNIIDEINNITLVKFKSVTKRYMINKYSYYCNIRNCYICQL